MDPLVPESDSVFNISPLKLTKRRISSINFVIQHEEMRDKEIAVAKEAAAAPMATDGANGHISQQPSPQSTSPPRQRGIIVTLGGALTQDGAAAPIAMSSSPPLPTAPVDLELKFRNEYLHHRFYSRPLPNAPQIYRHRLFPFFHPHLALSLMIAIKIAYDAAVYNNESSIYITDDNIFITKVILNCVAIFLLLCYSPLLYFGFLRYPFTNLSQTVLCLHYIGIGVLWTLANLLYNDTPDPSNNLFANDDNSMVVAVFLSIFIFSHHCLLLFIFKFILCAALYITYLVLILIYKPSVNPHNSSYNGMFTSWYLLLLLFHMGYLLFHEYWSEQYVRELFFFGIINKKLLQEKNFFHNETKALRNEFYDWTLERLDIDDVAERFNAYTEIKKRNTLVGGMEGTPRHNKGKISRPIIANVSTDGSAAAGATPHSSPSSSDKPNTADIAIKNSTSSAAASSSSAAASASSATLSFPPPASDDPPRTPNSPMSASTSSQVPVNINSALLSPMEQSLQRLVRLSRHQRLLPDQLKEVIAIIRLLQDSNSQNIYKPKLEHSRFINIYTSGTGQQQNYIDHETERWLSDIIHGNQFSDGRAEQQTPGERSSGLQNGTEEASSTQSTSTSASSSSSMSDITESIGHKKTSSVVPLVNIPNVSSSFSSPSVTSPASPPATTTPSSPSSSSLSQQRGSKTHLTIVTAGINQLPPPTTAAQPSASPDGKDKEKPSPRTPSTASNQLAGTGTGTNRGNSISLNKDKDKDKDRGSEKDTVSPLPEKGPPLTPNFTSQLNAFTTSQTGLPTPGHSSNPSSSRLSNVMSSAMVPSSPITASSSLSSRNSLVSPEQKSFRDLFHNFDSWDYDVFEVSTLTQGKPLLFIGTALFRKYNLLSHFNLNTNKLTNFFNAVENNYLKTNPYHNSIHAADVARSCHFFVNNNMRAYCNELELLSLFIAGLCHDIAHPAKTNAYLIATRDPLSIVYNDKSILENFHASQTFQLLLREENNLFDGSKITGATYATVRKNVVDLILATDLASQFEVLTQFKNVMTSGGTPNAPNAPNAPSSSGSSGSTSSSASSTAVTVAPSPPTIYNGVDVSQPSTRLLCLKMCLKCADLGHAAKSLHLHKLWSSRITEEFYQQGDSERKRGLPISPFMNREKQNVSKSQSGFLDFLVIPLFQVWLKFVDSDDVMGISEQLKVNRQFWATQMLEQNEKMQSSSTTTTTNTTAATTTTSMTTTASSLLSATQSHRPNSSLSSSAPASPTLPTESYADSNTRKREVSELSLDAPHESRKRGLTVDTAVVANNVEAKISTPVQTLVPQTISVVLTPPMESNDKEEAKSKGSVGTATKASESSSTEEKKIE